MQNKLSPIKGVRTKQVKFLTADIEAANWIDFLVIGLYDGKKKHYKFFENLHAFLDYIFDYCLKQDIYDVFCHFGGKYDFNFIIQEICMSPRFTLDNIIPRGSGILCFSMFERNSINVDHRGNPLSISFRDSSGLLPMALRSLAKAFNVEVQKGDIDYTTLQHSFTNVDYTNLLLSKPEEYIVYYNKKKILKTRKNYKKENITYTLHSEGHATTHIIYDKNDVLFYLEKDCVAHWQVMDTFFNWPMVKKAGQCFTTASQAVKIWQTFITDDIFSLTKRVDNFVRRGYFGGRTEVFRPVFDSKYDIKNNPSGFGKAELKYLKKQAGQTLYCYDINSLYPTVMLENDYPIKCAGFSFGENYDPNELGMWEVDVDVPKDMFMPPLPTKHTFKDGTEKLIFPTGKFSGVFTNIEIEYARSLGVKIVNIKSGYTFYNGGRIFETFISDLYAKRLVAKREKDGVTNLLTKLIMNSCYGRLGLNTDRENLVLDIGQVGVKLHSEIETSKGRVRFMRNKVELSNSFTNVAISAFVTSHARIMLHKTLNKLGKDIYYCDTDSVFTTRKLPTGDELGMWKEEYNCKSACFLLPKSYYIGDIDDPEDKEAKLKIAIKGFQKKKIQHFQFEDFIHTLIGEQSKLKIIQEPKFATLKTALNKGYFLCMNYDPETNKKIDERKSKENFERTGKHLNFSKKEYKPSTRTVKAKYDKRELADNSFMSYPLHL